MGLYAFKQDIHFCSSSLILKRVSYVEALSFWQFVFFLISSMLLSAILSTLADKLCCVFFERSHQKLSNCKMSFSTSSKIPNSQYLMHGYSKQEIGSSFSCSYMKLTLHKKVNFELSFYKTISKYTLNKSSCQFIIQNCACFRWVVN